MKNFSDLSKEDYATFRARFALDVYRKMVIAFRAREMEGLTRQQLAERLGIDKSVVSRRLNGATNLTLGVISDMFRAMGYRPMLEPAPYEDLAGDNSRSLMTMQKVDKAATRSTEYKYLNPSGSTSTGTASAGQQTVHP